MSSISNTIANELALLLFNNTDIANIGDAAGLQNSATAGSYYLHLHTADPGDAGNSSTSECAYTSYASVAVARSGAGWTVTSRAVTNAADIIFPTSGSGPEIATHWSIAKESAGASVIMFKGTLTTPLTININIAPRINAGDLDINF